jgi:hypothetical protein
MHYQDAKCAINLDEVPAKIADGSFEVDEGWELGLQST